jgi:hypothetical protein
MEKKSQVAIRVFYFSATFKWLLALRVARRWLTRTWVAPYVLFFFLWAPNNIWASVRLHNFAWSNSSPTFFPHHWTTSGVESCSNMLVTCLSSKLGLKLDMNSSSSFFVFEKWATLGKPKLMLGSKIGPKWEFKVFFFWKVNNFQHQKLLIYGEKIPKLVLESKVGPK